MRPDDIPQDVWDTADSLCMVLTGDIATWHIQPGGVSLVAVSLSATLHLSRAIVAAKADERAACLAEVRKEIEYTRSRMPTCESDDRMLKSQAWGMCSDTAGVIAERIRKRSEG